MQSDYVIAKIHEIINRQVYKALDFSKRGGKDYEFSEVPGLVESGWTLPDYESAKGTEEKTFEEQCNDILTALNEHENSWPFRQAVNQK